MKPDKPTNYWDYIRVDDLLSLQGGLESDESELTNDEVLFITVHQVFELWFKLILRELGALRDFFHQELVDDQEMSKAVRSIQRINVLFRRCASHFEVIETLTTREYLGFRDKLMPASGFQSAQMRQMEILLGLDDESRVPLGLSESYMEALRGHGGANSTAFEHVAAQKLDGPSLAVAIEEWLLRAPIDGVRFDAPDADAGLARFIDAYIDAAHQEVSRTCEIALARSADPAEEDRLRARYEDEKRAIVEFLNPTDEEGGARRRRVRAAALFVVSYRELPLLAWPREVLDGLIELEQVMLIFRQRHARMVERVIGRRTGTGGSSGVDYLDRTALVYRVFRDLWAVRTYQIRRESNPPLANPGFYDFANA